MELAKIEFEPIGFGLHKHNMPCAVCREKPAVFCTPEMVFQPCWDCQKRGYKIYVPGKILRFLLERLT